MSDISNGNFLRIKRAFSIIDNFGNPTLWESKPLDWAKQFIVVVKKQKKNRK